MFNKHPVYQNKHFVRIRGSARQWRILKSVVVQRLILEARTLTNLLNTVYHVWWERTCLYKLKKKVHTAIMYLDYQSQTDVRHYSEQHLNGIDHCKLQEVSTPVRFFRRLLTLIHRSQRYHYASYYVCLIDATNCYCHSMRASYYFHWPKSWTGSLSSGRRSSTMISMLTSSVKIQSSCGAGKMTSSRLRG